MFYYNLMEKKTVQVNINGCEFAAETVDSLRDQALGLGKRVSMEENEGMLFVFPEKNFHSFWMKDMNFDLDIVWIRGDEIVYLAKNVSRSYPYPISPDQEADKVLEINSGLGDRCDIKVGNKVDIKQ